MPDLLAAKVPEADKSFPKSMAPTYEEKVCIIIHVLD